MIRVGTFSQNGLTAKLDARLNANEFKNFEPDLYVVTQAGQMPIDNRLLLGSTSLFQKLHHREQTDSAKWNGELAVIDNGLADKKLLNQLRSLLGNEAQAEIGPVPNASTTLQLLVEKGRRSFFKVTFNGNGRTCGTCHRENNNLTIDPKFIATLPKSDPLFVAETHPALSKDFEDPYMMRSYGLIRGNADGFDDLANKFVMRGVPHTLALIANSLKPSETGLDGSDNKAVTERTGWGGDSAPGTGTLREFVIGAVVQHYPKTLGRLNGVDFRLPTETELDALEAFQKSLGRKQDLQLSGANALKLKSAAASRGQFAFNSPRTFPAVGAPLPPGTPQFFSQPDAGAGKCLFCHFNAGAGDFVEAIFLTRNTNPATGVALANLNFDTGVEDLTHPAKAVVGAGRLPADGGFGRAPLKVNGRFLGYGIRTFNTPPLVEAADTVPLFHNNAVKTIEEA
jgi:hypothetical protein